MQGSMGKDVVIIKSMVRKQEKRKLDQFLKKVWTWSRLPYKADRRLAKLFTTVPRDCVWGLESARF
jgi:hypothetical protein